MAEVMTDIEAVMKALVRLLGMEVFPSAISCATIGSVENAESQIMHAMSNRIKK
jgi:hypothetical protein